MFRLIATDLDGTLLRSDKTISKETEDTLAALGERGVYFVPSTGRTHKELPDAVRGIPFLRYAITTNGGGVYDFKEERYIFNFTIEKEIGERVLKACRKLPVYPTIVCEGHRTIRTDDTGKVPEYIRQKAAPGIVEKADASADLIRSLHETEAGLQKLFLYTKGEELTPQILSALQEQFPELLITTSGPIYVEINAAGIDKGKTLRLLCDHLNIPIEECIAFGDAANDLAMLAAAGTAVVPENGTAEAKALADHICETCDEDGVRKALERMIKG